MASGTLLIVDDEESTRRMLTLGCEGAGYNVHSAESAEAALDWLRQSPVDSVLPDLNLHGMNGTELCRRLAEESPDIPAIVMTAFGTLENAVETMRVGAYDFLSKPLSIDALPLAVDRAVTHHAARRGQAPAGGGRRVRLGRDLGRSQPGEGRTCLVGARCLDPT